MSNISINKFAIVLLSLWILLSFCSASFAQTEQELDAEAERVVQKYLNQNLENTLKQIKSDSSESKNILKIDPLNPDVYYALTKEYVSGTHMPEQVRDKRVATFQTYIRLKPNDTWGYWNFAQFLKNIGYVWEADKYYAKSLELADRPGFADHYIRGWAAYLNGNYRQCVESMEKATTLTPENGDQRWTYAYLSVCQRALGDKKNAEINLQKAVNLGGDEVANDIDIRTAPKIYESEKCGDKEKMLRKYIDKEYKPSQFDNQYIDYAKLRNCFPLDAEVAGQGSVLTYRKTELLGWDLVYSARKQNRKTPYSELSEDERLNLSNTQYKAVLELLKNRQYEQALEQSAWVLLYDPTNPNIRWMRARAFLFLMEPEFYDPAKQWGILAWREANIILKQDPQFAQAKIIRARVYYDLKGNRDKALAEITEALKLAPNNAEAHFVRGKIYYGDKEYAKAISEFDTALRLLPNFHDAIFYKKLAENPQSATAMTAEKNRVDKLRSDYRQLESSVIEYSKKYDTFVSNSGSMTKSARCEEARNHERKLNYYQSEFNKLEKSITPDANFYNAMKNWQNTLQKGTSIARDYLQKNCQ